MKRTFADLFTIPPASWGARGERYFWEDLRLHALQNSLPLPDNFENFVQELNVLFEDLTGHTVTERDWFFVDKYAHGGMSSGHIDPKGWREGGKIFNYLQQIFYRVTNVPL